MDERLPESLRASGFAYREAREHGISPGVLRGERFATPFRGVRSAEAPTGLRERTLAFAPLRRPWQCLGGVSALAMLGLPVPRRLRVADAVEVVSITGRGHPERRGVRVRRLAADRFRWVDVEGVRVASPPLAWALMGHRCSVHELVVLGDAIVTDAANYPDRRIPGPLASLDELRAIAATWRRGKGVGALHAALPRIRAHVESPRESDMRLLIVDAGMPEPEVQVPVHDPADGRFLGRADLMHRAARVVEEYEGTGHRAERQWDRDIEKYRDFERVGLHVVRATHRDFVPSPARWLDGLAAVLARRTPR